MGPGEREFFAFLAMFLAGGGVGLAYDVGTAARVASGRRSSLPALVDACVVLAAGLGAATLWFRLTWGERRWYLLAAVLLGATCYRYLASPLVGRALARGALGARGLCLGAGREGRRLVVAAHEVAARLLAAGRSWLRRVGRFL